MSQHKHLILHLQFFASSTAAMRVGRPSSRGRYFAPVAAQFYSFATWFSKRACFAGDWNQPLPKFETLIFQVVQLWEDLHRLWHVAAAASTTYAEQVNNWKQKEMEKYEIYLFGFLITEQLLEASDASLKWNFHVCVCMYMKYRTVLISKLYVKSKFPLMVLWAVCYDTLQSVFSVMN